MRSWHGECGLTFVAKLTGRMQDETARVEDVLLEKQNTESLVKCFVEASGVSFEGILDP